MPTAALSVCSMHRMSRIRLEVLAVGPRGWPVGDAVQHLVFPVQRPAFMAGRPQRLDPQHTDFVAEEQMLLAASGGAGRGHRLRRAAVGITGGDRPRIGDVPGRQGMPPAARGTHDQTGRGQLGHRALDLPKGSARAEQPMQLGGGHQVMSGQDRQHQAVAFAERHLPGPEPFRPGLGGGGRHQSTLAASRRRSFSDVTDADVDAWSVGRSGPSAGGPGGRGARAGGVGRRLSARQVRICLSSRSRSASVCRTGRRSRLTSTASRSAAGRSDRGSRRRRR